MNNSAVGMSNWVPGEVLRIFQLSLLNYHEHGTPFSWEFPIDSLATFTSETAQSSLLEI